MNKYETIVHKFFNDADAGMDKTAAMAKEAEGYEIGAAMARGFFNTLGELVKEAADEAGATGAANAIAQQANAIQQPVADNINTQAGTKAPNPGNDLINSDEKAKIQAFLQAYAADPNKIKAVLATMSPDQVAALMKVPEIADKIRPILTAVPTNTIPTNVAGTGTPDPANTPGATPVV